MSTTGHESEAINVQGLKASLQKLKTNHIDAEATRAQAAEASLSSGKADKSTTLAGYGITDAYTKSETYTKTEVNGLVDTPHQDYVTVPTYASLPASGSKDTIYRVSNYNGSTSQVDASVYSEYAWNGSQYVFLCVKSQIGEVFDISVYNNNAKYADLSAALGASGANVPQELRKGGMSVKYVHSSDNKYVQFRLMADGWSTNADDWSIADEGVYVENPEFIYVKPDAKGKILWAIKRDGSPYFGYGCPPQVVEWVNQQLKYKADGEYIENSEWLNVVTDENGGVLEGIRCNGHKYLPFPSNQDEVLFEEIKKINQTINSDKTSVISVKDYNLEKTNKCEVNTTYMLYGDSPSPFKNLRVIKNGNIVQDTADRDYITKIAIFGDCHFGYNYQGSPAGVDTEELCGEAFEASNSKNADFAMIMGDILEGGSSTPGISNEIAENESYKTYYEKVALLNVPLFPLEGNHDETHLHHFTFKESIKKGVIQFENVRIICFNAHEVYEGTYAMGDVSDETYNWLENAVKESHNGGFITILACHYSLYYDAGNLHYDEPIRNHRDDIIELCYQYNVRLYIYGHEHNPDLQHTIVHNSQYTLDMTEVMFGFPFKTTDGEHRGRYNIMIVTENGFTITAYNASNGENERELFIPMTNQASGTTDSNPNLN